jgi:hypothetical protein
MKSSFNSTPIRLDCQVNWTVRPNKPAFRPFCCRLTVKKPEFFEKIKLFAYFFAFFQTKIAKPV